MAANAIVPLTEIKPVTPKPIEVIRSSINIIEEIIVKASKKIAEILYVEEPSGIVNK